VTPASLRVARVPSSAKNVTIGDEVTTLGWGAVFPESIGELFGPSSIVRSVTTTVTPDDVCALAYMSVAKTQPPYMFFAAGNESGPCPGTFSLSCGRWGGGLWAFFGAVGWTRWGVGAPRNVLLVCDFSGDGADPVTDRPPRCSDAAPRSPLATPSRLCRLLSPLARPTHRRQRRPDRLLSRRRQGLRHPRRCQRDHQQPLLPLRAGRAELLHKDGLLLRLTPQPVLPVLQHFRFGGHVARRVAVQERTVGACRIKVLLMAHRYGDPAPVTQMTRLPIDEEEAAAGGPIATTECTVRVSGTVDKYTLMLGPDGRTRSSHAGREESVAEDDPSATELLPVAGEADRDGDLTATDGEGTCAADEAGSCTDMLALADVLRDISSVVIDGVTYGGRGGGDDEQQWLLSPLMGTDSALAKIDSYVAVADESTTAGTDAWCDEVTGVNRIVAAVKGRVPYVVVVDDVKLAAHAKGERHATDFVLPLASPTARLVDLRDTFAIVEDGPRRMAVCQIFPHRSTLPKPQPEVTWPVRLERYLTAGGVQAKRLVVPSLSATPTMSSVAIVPLGAFGVPTCTPLGSEGAAWIECGGQRDAIQIVDDGNDDSEHCGIVIERLEGVVPAAADGADATKVAALNAVPVDSTAEDKLLVHILLRAHTATGADVFWVIERQICPYFGHPPLP